MKFRFTLSLLALVAVAVTFVAAQSDTARTMLEAARKAEVVDGDLNGAIKRYQAIVAQYAKTDRALVATALVRMADSYRKLGNPEWRNIYERVVREFADQKDAVAEARANVGATATLARRRLWSGVNLMLFSGAASPDGRFLTANTGGDLGVRDVVTGITRQVTNSRKGDPVKNPAYVSYSRISPDGKRIAFAWNPRVSEPELRIIGIDGSKEETIYRNPESDWIGDVDWALDGRQVLAKVRTRNSTGQIAWISVGDKTARILKTLPWTSLGRMALSPDSRHIAYDAGPDAGSKNRTIFVLASDGSKETALTAGLGETVVGWMPDGKALLFATNRRGSRELWAIRVVDGKPAGAPGVIQEEWGGTFEPLGITKNGSLFYMQISVTGFANVSSVDWNTGSVSAIKDVSDGLIPDMGAAWSPDGRNLAFIAHRGSNLLTNRFIAIRSIDTGEGRDLVPGDLIATSVKWFPDGNSFLVNLVYTVDAKTGNVRKFLDAYQSEWMPDRKSVMYETRDRTGRANARLFIRELESGTDREVPVVAQTDARPLFINFALSPDGQHLAFIPGYSPHMTVSVMPPNGGPSRQLLSGDRLLIIGWTPDSRRIVYSKGEVVTGEEVWSVPLEGGEPVRLQLQLNGDRTKGFSIHPDGRRILYTGSRQEREVWTLENLIPVVQNALRIAK